MQEGTRVLVVETAANFYESGFIRLAPHTFSCSFLIQSSWTFKHKTVWLHSPLGRIVLLTSSSRTRIVNRLLSNRRAAYVRQPDSNVYIDLRLRKRYAEASRDRNEQHWRHYQAIVENIQKLLSRSTSCLRQVNKVRRLFSNGSDFHLNIAKLHVSIIQSSDCRQGWYNWHKSQVLHKLFFVFRGV